MFECFICEVGLPDYDGRAWAIASAHQRTPRTTRSFSDHDENSVAGASDHLSLNSSCCAATSTLADLVRLRAEAEESAVTQNVGVGEAEGTSGGKSEGRDDTTTKGEDASASPAEEMEITQGETTMPAGVFLTI